MKGIQIGKKRVNLSLFTDDVLSYIENPKESTKKTLEVIIKFSKIERYRINIKTNYNSMH